MDGISYNRSLCRLSHFLFIYVLFSSIPLICRLESSFYSISHSISYRLGFLPFLFFHYCRKFSSFPFSPSNSKSTKSERVFIPHVSQFPQLYHHPTNLNNEERNVIREKERKKKEICMWRQQQLLLHQATNSTIRKLHLSRIIQKTKLFNRM